MVAASYHGRLLGRRISGNVSVILIILLDASHDMSALSEHCLT